MSSSCRPEKHFMSMLSAALLALHISHLPLLIWMLPISEDITAITPHRETRSWNVSMNRQDQ
jgi:hypothetical protein